VLGNATLGGKSPCHLARVFARSARRELHAGTPTSVVGFVADAETIDHELGSLDDAATPTAVGDEKEI